MLGIVPTITNPNVRSVGFALASGRLLPVIAGAIIAAFGVARYRTNRRAVATMRSARSLAMAHQAAGLLLVGVEDLAHLLGLARAEVARWVTDGVPARDQRAVADLLHATVALRRRFPAPVAKQLLAVRVEQSAAVEDARRQLTDLSRTSRHGHISVTLR
jgi:hypothetical protein